MPPLGTKPGGSIFAAEENSARERKEISSATKKAARRKLRSENSMCIPEDCWTHSYDDFDQIIFRERRRSLVGHSVLTAPGFAKDRILTVRGALRAARPTRLT